MVKLRPADDDDDDGDAVGFVFAVQNADGGCLFPPLHEVGHSKHQRVNPQPWNTSLMLPDLILSAGGSSPNAIVRPACVHHGGIVPPAAAAAAPAAAAAAAAAAALAAPVAAPAAAAPAAVAPAGAPAAAPAPAVAPAAAAAALSLIHI